MIIFQPTYINITIMLCFVIFLLRKFVLQKTIKNETRLISGPGLLQP